MMNKPTAVFRPFLSQFEVEIPQQQLDPALSMFMVLSSSIDVPIDNIAISKALGVTKLTRVRDETTDDE